MSRQGDATTPSQLERGAPVSPSPAHDALRTNLEGGLTLNRKRSWFGSARDILSKAWKGDGSSRTDENEDRGSSIQNEEADIGLTDDDSTTPLRPRPERQRTFTPKHAISSLRQHLASSNHRHKRAPLADMTHNEMRPPVGPERIITSPATHDDCEDDVKPHARKTSLGRSIVGSIRTLGMKSIRSRTTSPSKTIKDDQLSPTKQAAAIPLPSSPIAVVPPPTLHVDLGPSALLSTSPPPDRESEPEPHGIADPKNIIGERLVPTYYTRLPGEEPCDNPASAIEKVSLTPSDLLQLPTDEFGFSMPGRSTTPTSAPKHQAQADGSNDEIELFERSVEYKDKTKKKEGRSLKKMVSLDAMAEECATSPPSNPPSKLAPGDPQRTRGQPSLTTIESCPDDMPAMTRQLAHLQTPTAGHRDPTSGKWISEDPFAPGNPVGDIACYGPPSPTRSVKLPCRPKITVQSTEAAEPKTYDESDLATPDASRQESSERKEDIKPDSVMPAASDQQSTAESYLSSSGKAGPLPATVDSEPQSKESLARIVDTGEYGEFKTQQLFGDLGEPDLPVYVDAETPERDGHGPSIQNGQSVAQLYRCISKSQRPSPPRCGAGTTHTPDVSDVFWKLDLCEQTHAPDQSPRALKDISYVDISAGHSTKSEDSPATTTSNRTPNMGDPVEFEIKRSARNIRYNALNDISSTPDHGDDASLPTSMRPAPLRPSLKLDTANSSIVKSNSNLSLMSFDAWAYSSSRKNSPLKPSARQSRVGVSSDSIDHDLKNAISQHYVFQAAVAGLGIDEPYSSSTANMTPSESRPTLGRDRSQKGASVSPGISPDSYNVWENMEFGPFDTPPGKTKNEEEGKLNEYEFKTPLPGTVLADETLDDCLEMFHNFNKSQEVLSSDNVQPAEKIENPFSSSPLRDTSQGSSASQVSPSKRPLPSRYRNSKRGRN